MFHSSGLADRSTLRRQLVALPKSPRLYLAVFLGLLFGLFLYSYWFVNLLPAGSRLLALLTVAAGAVGAAAYYYLLKWLAPRLVGVSYLGCIALAVISLLFGASMFFGGTTAWTSPARSIEFLLPTHRLEVKATGNRGMALVWFTTALGDVSYNTLRFSGWKRSGDMLVLENPEQNSLEWTGRTGESTELVWRGSANDRFQLSWDGQVENLAPAGGRLTVSHSFSVPWYASRIAVWILGVLIFASFVAPLALLLWNQRGVLMPTLGGGFAATSQPWSRLDTIILAGAGVLALGLRLPNLGVSYPPVDEYYHLIAARQIVEGAALNSVYGRGLWLVTMPVSLSLRLFGFNLWAARLPGVLFNVLAILPLYLLARKITRPVAALSVALYATSPWIVTFARIAREYAFYPFYFYWIVLGMVLLVERIPRDFVVVRDWKILLRPQTILLAALLLVPPLFAFFGDPLSTFRTIMIAYLVLGMFVLARLNFLDRSNWPFLGALVAGVILIGFAAYRDQSSKISLLPAFNPVPVSYFVPNPQQQWYYGQLVPLVLIALIAVVLCGLVFWRKNFVPLFVFVLYAAGLLFFAFLSKIFFHTRHLLTTELWFVIVLSVGLYLLWKAIVALVRWQRRFANVLLAAVLGIALINWQQLVAPVISSNPDNAISEDYLHDMSQVQQFMLDHAQSQDALISTVYGLYSTWKAAPAFRAEYRISTLTSREEVLSLIAQHSSGWIVVDQIRLEASAFGPNAFAGNPDVEYIGLFGDENVWHWQHPAGVLGSAAVAGKGEWIYR